MSGPGEPGPAAVRTAVVDAYFAAIVARDVDALRRLFTPGARLDAEGMCYEGTEAIARFYADGAFAFDDLLPRPGPAVVEGDRVTVTIDLQVGGERRLVEDVFRLDGDRIAALCIRGLGDGVSGRLRQAAGPDGPALP